MKKIITTWQKMKESIKITFGGGKCTKCCEWLDDDDDCCQTYGYPWSD